MQLATHIVNQLSGGIEYSDQQAAAANLGMPASTSTTIFTYVFIWAAIAFAVQADVDRAAAVHARGGDGGGAGMIEGPEHGSDAATALAAARATKMTMSRRWLSC
jgi:hypothetical protein